jgi:hypothetical protein
MDVVSYAGYWPILLKTFDMPALMTTVYDQCKLFEHWGVLAYR